MNSIDDDRVAFYFKHQRQIDEWYDIRDDAMEVANRFYCSLLEPVQQLAQDLDAQMWNNLGDDRRPGLFLYRAEWPRKEQEPPLVAVGIQWGIDYCGFLGEDRAFVGVRVNTKLPGGKDVSAALRNEVSGRPGFDKPEGRWPIWRYEGPHAEFWKDLAPFREGLIQSITDLWEQFSDAIDTQIESLD